MLRKFKGIIAITLIILSYHGFAEQKEIVTGYELSVKSEVMNEDRKLLISLPVGYQTDKHKRYPVLYTLDGDTHFQHISGTVDWLSNQAMQIPRMIVVAITNTNRGRDMTASHNKGGAGAFSKFIETELIPFIDGQYRTEPFRILAGHSMAGHFALGVFNSSPQLFNAYIAMSPFFLQDRGETKLVDMLTAQLAREIAGNPFVYTSIGNEKRLMPAYKQLVSGLDEANDNVRWQSFVSDDDTHMSIPSNTINNALRFVFEPMRLSPRSDIAQQGVDAITRYYQDISKNIYEYTISAEPTINQLGYHILFNDKAPEKALKVFRANAHLYPQSANAHDSLAEGYKRNGQFDLALAAINQAIALTQEGDSDNMAYYRRHKTRIQREKENNTE